MKTKFISISQVKVLPPEFSTKKREPSTFVEYVVLECKFNYDLLFVLLYLPFSEKSNIC